MALWSLRNTGPSVHDMNADFPESMSDSLDRLSLEPSHTWPDPCTREHDQPKCLNPMGQAVTQNKTRATTKQAGIYIYIYIYIYTLICLLLGQWLITVQGMDLTTCPNLTWITLLLQSSGDSISDLTQFVMRPSADFDKLSNSTIQPVKKKIFSLMIVKLFPLMIIKNFLTDDYKKISHWGL